MTIAKKFDDLQEGDVVRVSSHYEGTLVKKNWGFSIEKDDKYIFEIEEEFFDYDDDVTVEILERRLTLKVGQIVSAGADLPFGTVLRYANASAGAIFKTMDGWATTHIGTLKNVADGDCFRIEYLPNGAA